MELYILYNNLKHFSTVLRQMTIDINKKITTSSIHYDQNSWKRVKKFCDEHRNSFQIHGKFHSK